eukprot:gene10113-biopygen19778
MNPPACCCVALPQFYCSAGTLYSPVGVVAVSPRSYRRKRFKSPLHVAVVICVCLSVAAEQVPANTGTPVTARRRTRSVPPYLRPPCLPGLPAVCQSDRHPDRSVRVVPLGGSGRNGSGRAAGACRAGVCGGVSRWGPRHRRPPRHLTGRSRK